jgi:hypothetical protein
MNFVFTAVSTARDDGLTCMGRGSRQRNEHAQKTTLDSQICVNDNFLTLILRVVHVLSLLVYASCHGQILDVHDDGARKAK